MKTTSLIAFASLCLLTAGAGAVDFPPQIVPNTVGTQVNPGTPDSDFALLEQAGVKVVRVLCDWSVIDHNEVDGTGTHIYRSDAMQTIYDTLDRATAHHMRVKVYMAEPNVTWTEANGTTHPGYYHYTDCGTSFCNDFSRFCNDMMMKCATHMRGLSGNQPMTFEVGNEPNLPPPAGSTGLTAMTAAQYMAVANATFGSATVQSIKTTILPNTTFVGPAYSLVKQDFSPDDKSFLQYCMSHGLGNLVDGISVHPYRTSNPESMAVSTTSNHGTELTYADLHAICGNVPIVCGEVGYPSANNYWGVSISQQTQADYLARLNLVNLSQGIPYTTWFYYKSGGYDPNDANQNWGILGPNNELRPAYHAAQTLTSTLKDAWFDHQIGSIDPNGVNMLVFNKPTSWGNKWILAAWNAANANSINTDSYWGTYTLTGTPLYCGQRLSWQGGTTGNWSDNNTWFGGNWPNLDQYGDNYQAQFDTTATVNVDGLYRISGLQFNANNVILWGNGALNFTDGGGNLYTGANNATIACKVTGGGDPSTFVLRKGGTGIVGLGAANDFRGRILIKEGAIALGNERSLGDIANPITLDGGQLITQGVRFKTTGAVDITASSSVISNYTTGTSASWDFPTASVSSSFNVTTNAHANVELYGQLNSNDTSNVLMKWGDGTLTLGGPGDNISMSLDAKQGTVNLNKMSVSGTHAVFGINSVDSGAKVKYTGTGDYQVYGGGPITLTGGAIDFNGHNQASTGTVTVSTADSTLANTASGTTSTFSPAQIKMNQNMTVNAVGDLTIAGQISYTGSNNSSRTLTKTGTGLLTLTNSSSRSNYRGGTVINEGNLLYATTASHPTTGATTINSGGALVAGGAYTTVSDWLNSSRGTINTSSTGSLALAANNSEAINLASYPSLSIGAAAGSYTYSGTLTPANSIYRFGGGGGTLTVSSALTGASRQLQVNGKGAVVLSGANTYQGGTTIDRGGILKFNSGALPSTGQVTINGDGTLVGEGAYSTVQSWLSSGRIATSSAGTLALTGTNTVALNMGNYNNLWLGAYGNATYSGTLTHGNNNGNSYLLGGGNGTLTIGSALHDATGQHSMVVVKNNVVFTNSGNDYTERTMIYGTLMLKSSASINSSNKIQLWNNGSLFADSTTPVTCPIEFDTAGTVGGTGTYNTNLNVANGGHLSPGASGKGSIGGMLVNGNIAMDASSVLDIDLTSPSNTDYLWLGYHTTQSVILDGIINLTYNGTDGAPAGGEYHIIRGLYLPNLTNNGLELGDVPIGHFWDLELQPTASGYYDLVAITAPEPGTWMISATGLAGLLAYRWRKRR